VFIPQVRVHTLDDQAVGRTTVDIDGTMSQVNSYKGGLPFMRRA
jgi:hypothetical protein